MGQKEEQEQREEQGQREAERKRDRGRNSVQMRNSDRKTEMGQRKSRYRETNMDRDRTGAEIGTGIGRVMGTERGITGSREEY
jgi:hypothetical protein